MSKIGVLQAIGQGLFRGGKQINAAIKANNSTPSPSLSALRAQNLSDAKPLFVAMTVGKIFTIAERPDLVQKEASRQAAKVLEPPKWPTESDSDNNEDRGGALSRQISTRSEAASDATVRPEEVLSDEEEDAVFDSVGFDQPALAPAPAFAFASASAEGADSLQDSAELEVGEDIKFILLEGEKRGDAESYQPLNAKFLAKIIGGSIAPTLPGQRLQIHEMRLEDVNPVQEGKMMVCADDKELIVHYGEWGKVPVGGSRTADSLTRNLVIPRNITGILVMRTNMYFAFSSAAEAVIITSSAPDSDLNISQVPEVMIFSGKYSCAKICSLAPDVARRVNKTIASEISESDESEVFGSEETLVKIRPTRELRVSDTLMEFAAKEGGNSDMHYHPSKRMLQIFTTDEPAGVILNFCGINDDPDARPDSRVEIKFEPNSLIRLTFPSYTHHEFFGKFVCLSTHPNDGKRNVEMINSGELKGGFLSGSTVSSRTGSRASSAAGSEAGSPRPSRLGSSSDLSDIAGAASGGAAVIVTGSSPLSSTQYSQQLQ